MIQRVGWCVFFLVAVIACDPVAAPEDVGLPADAGEDAGSPADARVADGSAPDAAAPDASTPCGDGVLDAEEECDDGNRDSTDGCLADCRLPAPLTRSVGPVYLRPSPHRPVVTFYLVSPGGPLQGALAVDRLGAPGGAGADHGSDPYPSRENIAVVRVLDPDESVVHWHYQAQGPADVAPRVVPSASERPPAFHFDEHGNLRDYRFALTEPGVYQVRVVTNSLKTALRLELPERVGVGVSYHNGAFAWPFCLERCGDTPPTTFWAWAPRHPSAPLWLELTPSGSGTALPALLDEGGTPLLPIERGAARRFVVAPGRADQGELWRVDMPAVAASAPMHFRAVGFPFILADSAESARAIHASVERVASGPHAGTLVHHRFQAEVLALLPEILSAEHAGGDAQLDALVTADRLAAPRSSACAEPPGDPDAVWRNLDLLDGWDGPLRAARFYLSRAAPSGGSVVFGGGAPILEAGPGHHWAGAVGLPFLERQRCDHDSDCVDGGGCDVASRTCRALFDPEAPRQRWDVLRGLRYTVRDGATYHDSFAGLALPHGAARHLALAATLAHPCNPWGPAAAGAPLPHPELLARAAAAGLAELLLIGEDDRFLPIADDDPYPGFMAFPLPQSTSGYAAVAPHLAEVFGRTPGLAARIQRVWGEGLRGPVDRMLAAYLLTALNQSSHVLLAAEELAHGLRGRPEDALYRTMARRFAERFAAAASPGGWLEEASGPSSSYAGMQHWHMARYLALTAEDPEGEDALLREALAASYAFFSAATVGEPDGQRTSGFNFSHRIGTGFELEQWRGARGLAETIPEVALWSEWQLPRSGIGFAAARSALRGSADAFAGPIGIHRSSLHGAADLASSLDSAARPPGLRLPSERPGSWVEVRGASGAPELIAVRRERGGGDAWYAALYVAPTAAAYAYGANWATTRRAPLTRADVVIEDRPAASDPRAGSASTYAIDIYASSPMIGGGLSILSTSSFGSALVAANWSPLTHHGLVAERDEEAGRRRYWESYESVTLDPAAGGPGGTCARTLTDEPPLSLTPTDPSEPPGVSVYSVLDGDPGLCVVRHLRFNDEGLEVRVVVQRIAPAPALPMDRLFENIPVPTCTRARCDRRDGGDPLAMLNRKAAGATLAAAPGGFTLRDAMGRGLDIRFDGSVAATAFPEGLRHSYYGEELQIGRIEAPLPLPRALGERVSIRYRLLPVWR